MIGKWFTGILGKFLPGRAHQTDNPLPPPNASPSTQGADGNGSFPGKDICRDGKIIHTPDTLWRRPSDDKPYTPSILVADDSRTNRQIVARVLELEGFEVTMVDNGTVALQELCQRPYSLAILDMRMPGITGPTVIRRFRRLRPSTRMPTIILTANDSMDGRTESADAGADCFLSKPIKSKDLVFEVNRLIRVTQVERLYPQEQPSAEEPPPDILDFDVLQEIEELYQSRDAIARFASDHEQIGEELLATIAVAYDRGQRPIVLEAIHELKVNAHTVGGIGLAHVCNLAEHENDWTTEACNRKLAALRDAFEATRQALKSYIGATSGSTT